MVLRCIVSLEEGTTWGLPNLTAIRPHHNKELSHEAKIASAFVMIVLLLTGVIGNGLVIFVTGYKIKTTVNSMWFLNLAITDLIFIQFLVYLIVDVFDRRVREDILLYKCGYFTFVLTMFASAFFLTVISVDRFLCTWCVVWAQNKRTLVKARIICVFVWLLSICCSIPFVVFISKTHKEFQTFEHYVDSCMSLLIYMFTVGFLIPFLIITSSYIAIGVRVRRLPRGNQIWLFRVIFVILAFFISWCPYHVLHMCIISASKNGWSDSVVEKLFRGHPFAICLVLLNSCLNPILYVFMCDEYKTKLKRSLLLALEGAFTEENLGLR
ncbi:C3a anaphylatoxin chemotactic receptor-like [Triplophysa dalaica]|uniref:C3a anaphylatoxin chemotactic receptor-like n=1 Tax=Triplophysa dalaica TaxID=1582913 RepID=UPI0024E017CD|nr:C3a anaphylatoxin chemotactic receptor-like [Triplophysa dalaica]